MTRRNIQKDDKLNSKSYVPSSFVGQQLKPKSSLRFYFATQLLLIIIIQIILKYQDAQCWLSGHELHTRRLQLPFTSQPDLLTDLRGYSGQQLQPQKQFTELLNSNEPTPPLVNSLNNHNDRDINRRDFNHQKLIEPHNVMPAGFDREPFSPVFDYPSADAHSQQDNSLESIAPVEREAPFIDPNELGSGAGYDSSPIDPPEDVAPTNKYSPTSVLDSQFKTPVFNVSTSGRSDGDKYDQAPLLMRRLPKLMGTAGYSWRYKIPSDTFHDEDGDLRHLKSSIMIEQYHKSEFQNTSEPLSNQGSVSKYLRWLQYDQTTQTLFGFPTDDDVGLNLLQLMVSDRWGSTSNETVEIVIRSHQSSRAFTHSIILNGIEWSNQRHISVPEVLTELVKSISEGVFSDHSDKSMVVSSYTLADKISNVLEEQTKQIITLTWSNSCLPIHPCDLDSIESIFKQLIDNRYLTTDWSLQTSGHYDMAPSQTLLRALSPDFRPSSVSINLQGACESKRSASIDHTKNLNSSDLELKIKNRLGKLRWKLGQPIWYEIPRDTFSAEGGTRNARQLSLSLHTIDGKTLDQDSSYNFLEFDQETQTIYGLPYDLTRHIGARELLLTARHPVTNRRIHETFIIDIESQDLTTVNNRAFRVSLYFMTRINLFGPREQVLVSRLMVESLGVSLNLDHDQDYPDFTVIDLQEFTTSSNLDNSATLNDPANAWKYQDKIMLVDHSYSGTRDMVNNGGTVFYKLTWTNETIGHFGECPVEVIKDNILYALERNMLDFVPAQGELRPEDPTKNDSVRFYERLRFYFEPSLDLIHLRFEPLSACIDALEIHDLGNSDIADLADKAGEARTSGAFIPTTYTKPLKAPNSVKEVSPINSDEYWAIVVLIILVVAIFFVIMMLLMGLHTYRINQEKRFELQMKLAQARQNSMYLSNMVLSDQAHPNDIMSQHSAMAKPIYVDERSSRKPVILDDEKQLLTNGTTISLTSYKPTTVQLMGQTVQTAPLKPNTTFTMDSIMSFQNNANAPLFVGNPQMFVNGDAHQSMTLNRRGTNSLTRAIGRQPSLSQLSHSQSILTVASMAPQGRFVPNSQANGPPFVHAPMPVFYESNIEMPHEL